MSASGFPVSLAPSSRLLTAADFIAGLMFRWRWNGPPTSIHPQTRRTYRNALEDFMKFTGIERPDEFREISRVHIVAGGLI